MNRALILFLGLIALISMISCSTSRKTAIIPEPRPLGEKYKTAPPSSAQKYDKETISLKSDTLTMAEAIQLAL